MKVSSLHWIGCWLVATGCAPSAPAEAPRAGDKAFVAGVRDVCQIDSLSGADGATDDLEREQRREDFLAEKVKHPDLIYQRTLWRVQGTKERAASVRDLAREAGIPRCPYADALEESNEAG